MQVRSVCHKVSGQVCRGMLLQFLGNILCEGVVVQQSADREILQGILRQIKILPHAHTDIGHSFSVFIFNVYQFCLDAVESIGTGTDQTDNINLHDLLIMKSDGIQSDALRFHNLLKLVIIPIIEL